MFSATEFYLQEFYDLCGATLYKPGNFIAFQLSPEWLADAVTSTILCLDGDTHTVYIHYLLHSRINHKNFYPYFKL